MQYHNEGCRVCVCIYDQNQKIQVLNFARLIMKVDGLTYGYGL